MSVFNIANWFLCLVRPVYRDEQVEEEVMEDQSAEVTLDQLEEEIQASVKIVTIELKIVMRDINSNR